MERYRKCQRGVPAKTCPFRRAMPSKRSASRVRSFGILPIDSTGPITEGIDVLPAQRSGQPFLAAGPADGFACAEIDDMRAAAEGIEARSGAGESILRRDQDYAAWPVPTL